MNYKRLNTYIGWLSFLIAFVVYAMTAERTASFWDCGEFISASAKLQVVHPPGAPLFLLIGNFFTHFASSPEQMGLMVNLLSALTSALCVMFTFWTITHFAKKLIDNVAIEEKVKSLLIVFSGFIGALALTFSDTFWFSAVEAEVYASSSFFTALTFWCILKWEHIYKEKGANKWLILIAYLIGLAIGVHLLNLLVIPAIVYVVYFKFREFNLKGFLIASGIGALILAVVQVGIIPGLPTIAMKLDITFVNSFGMGFGSGVIFFAILLVALIVGLLIYSQRTKNAILNTAVLCFTFILIGYSSYAMVVIRSLAEPTIDMNNPENPINLVSYLNREQYGDRPLLKGPYFNAKAIAAEVGKQDYRKGKEGYEKAGFPRPELVWDPNYVTIFPRMGDQQKASSPSGYAYWSGAKEDAPPKFSQNMRFFFKYQLGHMYWRYFLWNFAGKQDDIQGDGDILHGNWRTGINFLDAWRLGPQDNLPAQWANNKARNQYYLLPLILGILGLIYQLMSRKTDFLVVSMLFLFTGILIAVYLNAPPYEPRERDYTLVGSFQIFCIWIGLGVIQIALWLKKYMDIKVASYLSFIVCLLGVPVLMGAQNWDDHDRSERTMVVDFAHDYLMSCDSNAILFTNGDNDTYPLWYVQNVENYRTDVRVVNLQLLNFDWYVEALTRKVMDSEPFELSVGPEVYAKGEREQLIYFQNPQLGIDPNSYYNFKEVINFITNEKDPRAKMDMGRYYGPDFQNYKVNYLPVKNFEISIDKNIALSNGTIPPASAAYAVDRLRMSIPGNSMLKADWVLLDLIMNNNFNRPIYFASNSISQDHLGMGAYMRLDGLTYRLVPAEVPRDPSVAVNFDSDILYDKMVNQFSYGNMNNPDVLGDEQSYRMARTFRNYFGFLAVKLAKEGKKEKALTVIDKCLAELPPSVLPYEMVGLVKPLSETCYLLDEKEKGDAIATDFINEQLEVLAYCNRFKGRDVQNVVYLEKETMDNLNTMMALFQKYERNDMFQSLQAKLTQYVR